jgi:hypothetical protein
LFFLAIFSAAVCFFIYRMLPVRPMTQPPEELNALKLEKQAEGTSASSTSRSSKHVIQCSSCGRHFPAESFAYHSVLCNSYARHNRASEKSVSTRHPKIRKERIGGFSENIRENSNEGQLRFSGNSDSAESTSAESLESNSDEESEVINVESFFVKIAYFFSFHFVFSFILILIFFGRV